ncbi:MAG TPA: hypothetical protein VLJ13_05980 [Brevundimonas sp.]|nr:hypothetical protein [Brevundimonas sp.]
MGLTPVDHVTRRTHAGRRRSEIIETTMIIALAGLVLFKGAPAIGAIAVTTAEMMAELLRVLIAG